MEEYYRIALTKELWLRTNYYQINQYLVTTYTVVSTVNVEMNTDPNLTEEIV